MLKSFCIKVICIEGIDRLIDKAHDLCFGFSEVLSPGQSLRWKDDDLWDVLLANLLVLLVFSQRCNHVIVRSLWFLNSGNSVLRLIVSSFVIQALLVLFMCMLLFMDLECAYFILFSSQHELKDWEKSPLFSFSPNYLLFAGSWVWIR